MFKDIFVIFVRANTAHRAPFQSFCADGRTCTEALQMRVGTLSWNARVLPSKCFDEARRLNKKVGTTSHNDSAKLPTFDAAVMTEQVEEVERSSLTLR